MRGPGRRRISWLKNLRTWISLFERGVFRAAIQKSNRLACRQYLDIDGEVSILFLPSPLGIPILTNSPWEAMGGTAWWVEREPLPLNVFAEIMGISIPTKLKLK